MIRINLALRKQATALDSREKGGIKNLRLDTEAVRSALGDPQIRKLILVVAVAVLGTYLLDGYENDQLARMDQQVAVANQVSMKARAELAKTAGYEALKRQLDSDEELIRTKLSVIQKLVSDRQVPPEILTSLVGTIPKNVWITEMDMDESQIQLKGSSLGYDDITDFMKALGNSDYLTDLKLEDSEKAKSQGGMDVATFDIEAKRK